MRKALILAVLFAVAGLASTGCGGSDTPAADGPAPASGKPRVALIMKSLANEFFATMEAGARAHHESHAADYTLLTEGIKDELDVSRQVQLVEQMIGQRVDAIVIAPADSKALIPVCQRAMNAGIVVVNIDNKFDAEVLTERGITIPFVGPDNRAGARKVAEYLAQHLEPGSPVALVNGVPGAFNGIQRRLGFEDAMNAAGMEIIDSQSAGWEMAKANRVVSAMVTRHPDLHAVLCANDSMALGAVSALREAGKLDQVRVVGFDNIGAARELVRQGAILATADQHADQLAVFGIEYALQMLREGGTPVDRETPVDLVTAVDLP
jgi:ribose transport system substrate-binding protein